MLCNLAYAQAACAHPREALTLMERAAEIENSMLAAVAPVLSDQQRLGLLEQLTSHLRQVLAIVRQFFAHSPEDIHTAFRHVLTRKAISAEVMAAQRDAILAAPDPRMRGTQADLEEQVAREIPATALLRRLMGVTARQLAEALPRDSLLVEIVQCEAIAFETLRIAEADYCAFVVTSSAPDQVHLVELGRAGPIDDLVGDIRAGISTAGRSLFAPLKRPTFGKAGRELARLLIDPLRTFFGASSRIFISPDGMLNMLPFEVLPFDGKRLVMDCFEVSYLASGRDLLRLGRQGGPTNPAIVVADPNFDLAQSAVAVGQPDSNAPHFERLYDTRDEGERVAAFFGVKPWLGDEALEGRLKQISSPQVLHFATHGFFHTDRVRPEPAKSDISLKNAAEHLTASAMADNPLLRSGLALAAANSRYRGTTPPPAAEDGLLTALDVTAMNLAGTRLVVLSACVTGLGEIHPSEGTLGLRRSFTIAGAEALLVSLWNVPDRATKTLMLKVYRLLGQGLAPAAALHRAQAEMRRWNRNPYFWGAFVTYGGVPLISVPKVSR
jgi:CHAT domain-containing protein